MTRRYPAYKDSGVEWLGEVPEGWQISRSDEVVSSSMDLIASDALEGQTVFHYSIPCVQETGTGQYEEGSSIASSKLVVTEPSVLVSKLNPRKGTICIAEPQDVLTVCSGEFVPLIPKRADLQYVFYVVSSDGYRQQLESKTESATRSHQRVLPSDITKFTFAFPPLPEQQSIAAFLDRETAKIDALVAEQRRLIELLKEKRQAVISHAVTKGLDPTAPMKDSGVEWLGEVPEGWSTIQLRHVCALLKDGTHLPPPRVDDGVRLLSVRNIQDGRFGFRDDDSMISEDDFRLLARSFEPHAGDLLMAIVGATLGKVAVLEEMQELFHIQRSLALFRPVSGVSVDWMSLLFQSDNFQKLLWSKVGFSAQPGIYLGALSEVSIPKISLQEQLEIVRFVSPKLVELETLTATAQSAITLLQERRAALIAAAVTGKIDVRDTVASTEAA